ncbi:MAG: UvrD-helicase domain-containing protein [Spirochaetota bacterium]
MNSTLPWDLGRLVGLAGTDPGFYILAIHSFVEAYLSKEMDVIEEMTFPDLLWRFREQILENAGDRFVEELYCLKNLSKQHHLTNRVRHAFHDSDGEEAVATTHLFVVFCTLAGLADHPAVRELERSVHVWAERTSVLERSAALQMLQAELRSVQEKNEELLKQLSEYQSSQVELQQLELQVEQVDLELQKSRRSVEQKDTKIDELRAERRRLKEAQRQQAQKMRVFEQLARYIENLRRFSLYTRTRLDYERSLTRLTPEQLEAVENVDGDHDTLIRGGAGTGKSLVLIEALKKILTQDDFAFGGDYPEKRLLLTFTRALARYDAYLAGVLGAASASVDVRTIDSFFYSCLRAVDDDYRINYQILDELIGKHNETGILSDAELTIEIEALIFGGLVTEGEYLKEVNLRRGMRQRLSRGQRTEVWRIRDALAAEMEERKEFSKNYSRLVLLRHLEGDGGGGPAADRERLPRIRYLFLDETQDLTAADMRVLRLLTEGPMIMAGDREQALYGISSPFARAGISVAGRTRVLRTNFRNSCQIHALAEAFRKRGVSTAAPVAAAPEDETLAFRDGPIPELYRSDSKDSLLSLLVEKVQLFVEALEYEEENLAVLVPRNREVDAVGQALAQAGFRWANVADDEFSFESRGAIRISTLHSSKGLDFPVVLLFLPYLHRREQYDSEATERLLRNLVYVGLSRAMEHLCVFLLPDDDPVLQDIIRAFETTGNAYIGNP